MRPTVSVILPCRNEERYIEGCLLSVLQNGYPLDRLEVIVADGMSTDRTREIVEAVSARFPGTLRLIDNPGRVMPSGSNLGIMAAQGDFIFILNSHSFFQPGYIERCLRSMEEYQADCVGGTIQYAVVGDGLWASAIQLALTHPFGVGPSRHRTRQSGPAWSDSPGFISCRRAVLEHSGLFDEALRHSQDYELFSRMRRLGYRHLVDPRAVALYHSRDSFRGILRYFWRNGVWITMPIRLAGVRFAPRHMVPAAVVGLGAALLAAGLWVRAAWVLLAVLFGLYAVLAVGFAAWNAFRARTPLLAVTGPAMFFLQHTVMGVGSWWGLVAPIGRERARRASSSGPPRLQPRG